MFRVMWKAVTRRFTRERKPYLGEYPLGFPTPKGDGHNEPANVLQQDSSRSLPEKEIPFAELIDNGPPADAARSEQRQIVLEGEILCLGLNGNGTPKGAVLPELAPSIPENDFPTPELNGNGKPENAPLPERGRSVPAHEIQMRAYLKWEAAGKPKGQEARFWREAMAELLENAAGATSY